MSEFQRQPPARKPDLDRDPQRAVDAEASSEQTAEEAEYMLLARLRQLDGWMHRDAGELDAIMHAVATLNDSSTPSRLLELLAQTQPLRGRLAQYNAMVPAIRQLQRMANPVLIRGAAKRAEAMHADLMLLDEAALEICGADAVATALGAHQPTVTPKPSPRVFGPPHDSAAAPSTTRVFGPPHDATPSAAPASTEASYGEQLSPTHAAAVPEPSSPAGPAPTHPLNFDDYLLHFGPALRAAVVTRLLATPLALPAGAAFSDTRQALVMALVAELPTQAGPYEIKHTLGRWLGATRLRTIVDSARGVDAQGLGQPTWKPAVALELGNALVPTLQASLTKLARRLVAWHQQPRTPAHVLEPTALQPGSPLEADLAAAMVGNANAPVTIIAFDDATATRTSHASSAETVTRVTWGVDGFHFALRPHPATATLEAISLHLWQTTEGVQWLKRVGNTCFVPPALAGRRGTRDIIDGFEPSITDRSTWEGVATGRAQRGHDSDSVEEASRLAAEQGGPPPSLVEVTRGWHAVTHQLTALAALLAPFELHARVQAVSAEHQAAAANLGTLDGAGRQRAALQYQHQASVLGHMYAVTHGWLAPLLLRNSQRSTAPRPASTLNALAVDLLPAQRARLMQLLELLPATRLPASGRSAWLALLARWQAEPIEATRAAVGQAQALTGYAEALNQGAPQQAWRMRFGHAASADLLREEVAQLEATLATTTDGEARHAISQRLAELAQASMALSAGADVLLHAQEAIEMQRLLTSYDRFWAQLGASIHMEFERRELVTTAASLRREFDSLGLALHALLQQREQAVAAGHPTHGLDAQLQAQLAALRSLGRRPDVAKLVRQGLALADDFAFAEALAKFAATLVISLASSGLGAMTRGMVIGAEGTVATLTAEGVVAAGSLAVDAAAAARVAGTLAEVSAATLSRAALVGNLTETLAASTLSYYLLNEPGVMGVVNNLVSLSVGFQLMHITGQAGQAVIKASTRLGKAGALVGHAGALTLATAAQLVVGTATAEIMQLATRGRPLTGEEVRDVLTQGAAMGAAGYIAHVLCARQLAALAQFGQRLGGSLQVRANVQALQREALRLEAKGDPAQAHDLVNKAHITMAESLQFYRDLARLPVETLTRAGVPAPLARALHGHAGAYADGVAQIKAELTVRAHGLTTLNGESFIGTPAQLTDAVAVLRKEGLVVTEVPRRAAPEGVSTAHTPAAYLVALPSQRVLQLIEGSSMPIAKDAARRLAQAPATEETRTQDRKKVRLYRAQLDTELAKQNVPTGGYRLEVLAPEVFDRRMGASNDGGKTELTADGIVVYLRRNANAEVISHEAQHVAQLATPAQRELAQGLATHNLAAWSRLPLDERVRQHRNAATLERHATEQELATVAAGGDANVPHSSAATLNARLAQLRAWEAALAALDSDTIALINAGVRPLPEVLARTPELYAREAVLDTTALSALRRDAPTLALSSLPLVTDSKQSRMPGVAEVRHEGEVWQEAVPVRAHRDAHVFAINTRPDGDIEISLSLDGFRLARVLVEVGATVQVKPGQQVRTNDILALEAVRPCRLLRVQHHDGTVRRVTEEWRVNKAGDGQWLASGSHASLRGRIAEVAAAQAVRHAYGRLDAQHPDHGQTTEAVTATETTLRAQGVSRVVEIPVQNASGQGLDQVWVEFSGDVLAPTARLRVAEVKDYHKHVEFDAFTAIMAGRLRKGLADIADTSTTAAETHVAERPAWARPLSPAQLSAIGKAIAGGHASVELILGPTTKVSKRTLERLVTEAQNANLKVDHIPVRHLTTGEIMAATDYLIDQQQSKD